jgi:hypothetical protein
MKKFNGFTWPEGSYFPPELREIIPTIKSRAELAILFIILDSCFQSGLDATPLTFDQIMERTGLARQSVNDGIKRLLENGLIQRLSAGNTFAYEPSLVSRPPCHESSHVDSESNNTNYEYDHAWQSRNFTTLVQEFGVASRVAEDIAHKRDPAYVQKHIDYTRYEIKAGFQPRRLAGFIVARIRDDKPMPLGYTEKPLHEEAGEISVETELNLLCGYGRQGKAGIADPSQDGAQWFKYRDEAIQAVMEITGEFPNSSQQVAISELSAESAFSIELWEKSIHSCQLSKVKPGNVSCYIDTYRSGGDYVKMCRQHSNGAQNARSIHELTDHQKRVAAAIRATARNTGG